MLGLIGVIPGIIEALMQGSALQQQNNMNWQNLQLQKENAQKQYDLSTADVPVDAYGDTKHYNAALNKWENILTPTQKAITAATQREQNQALTVDAPRARALREAQYKRGQEAGKEYEQLFSEYKNKPPASEGTFADAATTDTLFSQQDKLRKGGNDLARLAIRAGQSPSAMASIATSVANQEGSGIGDALLAGKQIGQKEHANALQEYRTQLDPIKFFAGVQDDLGGYTPANSTLNSDLMSGQKDMMTAISQALANQSSQVGGAYKAYGAGLGQSPDLSGITNVLSKIDWNNLGGKGLEASVVAPNSGGAGTGILSNPTDPYGTKGYGLGDRTGSNLKAGFPSTDNLDFLFKNLNLNSNDYSWSLT